MLITWSPAVSLFSFCYTRPTKIHANYMVPGSFSLFILVHWTRPTKIHANYIVPGSFSLFILVHISMWFCPLYPTKTHLSSLTSSVFQLLVIIIFVVLTETFYYVCFISIQFFYFFIHHNLEYDLPHSESHSSVGHYN